MPLVTLSRTFGSGGGAVGRALAERLGAEYLDREVVARVAARSGIPEAEAEGYDERLPSLWQRLAAVLATSSPEAVVAPIPGQLLAGPAMGERLFAITRAVIEEAAATGNAVIVGRGGGWMLTGRPDLLRVQIHAPLDDRVRYLRARVEDAPGDTRPDASDRELLDLCRSVDRARAAYVRSHFDVDWMDLRHYDMVLDTGRLGLGRCVDLIELAARDLPARPAVEAAATA
ncbi:MAG: cytidylate kinase-like family protein [Candidatus Limnocylindrales bacterium]